MIQAVKQLFAHVPVFAFELGHDSWGNSPLILNEGLPCLAFPNNPSKHLAEYEMNFPAPQRHIAPFYLTQAALREDDRNITIW
jgi:hypothetical protein